MRIEFKRYQNTFTAKPIHKLLDDFGESNTDTSTWKPDVSSIRAFLGNPNNKKKMLYDFPDGKDTGETVQTFIRSKGLDITEVETAEKRITKIIEDKRVSDKEKAESKKNSDTIQKAFEKLASDDSNNSSDSPDQSNSPS